MKTKTRVLNWKIEEICWFALHYTIYHKNSGITTRTLLLSHLSSCPLLLLLLHLGEDKLDAERGVIFSHLLPTMSKNIKCHIIRHLWIEMKWSCLNSLCETHTWQEMLAPRGQKWKNLARNYDKAGGQILRQGWEKTIRGDVENLWHNESK